MFWDCLYYTSVVVFGLLALLVLRMSYRWRRALSKLAFYRDQKLFIYPGAEKFIFGNLFDTLAYTAAQKAAEEPIVMALAGCLTRLTRRRSSTRPTTQ